MIMVIKLRTNKRRGGLATAPGIFEAIKDQRFQAQPAVLYLAIDNRTLLTFDAIILPCCAICVNHT